MNFNALKSRVSQLPTLWTALCAPLTGSFREHTLAPTSKPALKLVSVPASAPALPEPSTVPCDQRVAQLARAYEAARREYGLTGMPPERVAAITRHIPQRASAASHDEIEAALGGYVRRMLGTTKPLTFSSPTTVPSTGHVYLIKEGTRRRAFLKVFAPPHENCLREITATAVVQRQGLAKMRHAAIHDCGAISVAGARHLFIISDAPGELDLAYVVRTSVAHRIAQQHCLAALKKAGQAIHELHACFLPSRNIQAIEAARRHHVEYVTRMIQPGGCVDAFHARGWLTAKQTILLRQGVAARAHAYAYEPLPSLPLSVTHGDCYPANFVLSVRSPAVALVDLQTLLWSLGPDAGEPTGLADGREDVGRLVEALEVLGLQGRMPQEHITALQAAFVAGYQGLHSPMPIKHLEFFRLRYDAVVFGALVHAWKSETGDVRLKVDEEATRRLLNRVFQRLVIKPSLQVRPT